MDWDKETKTQNNYSDIYEYQKHNGGAFSASIGINKTSELAGWSAGKDTPELKASLDRIRKAADELITTIDGHLAELQKEQVWEHLTADDVRNIQCIDSQYFPVVRTAEHTLTCEVHGEPMTLFYEVSKHDDGEGFTIHSDGKDIWDLMPEPELRKLEPVLSQAVSFAGWQKELEQAETAAAVRDVRYGLYETEYLNMSQEQISALHEAIDRKEAALTAEEGRSSEKQSVLEDLKTTKTSSRDANVTRKPKKQKEESR